MAKIRSLTEKSITVRKRHSEVDATFSIVEGEHGEKCFQIDTYGSDEREKPGAKSQSLRFGPESVEVLKRLLHQHYPD